MGVSFETLALAKEYTKEYVDEHGGGSVVKEIHEYDEYSYFPAEGSTEELYVDKSTGNVYRWSGSMYVEISRETIRTLLVPANNGKIIGIVNGEFVAIDKPANPLDGMDDPTNNGKVIGIVDGEFTPVEQTPNPLDGMDDSTNNGKVIGVVNGEFAPVEQTPNPLDGMDIAANNNKVLSVQNGSFAMVSIETIVPNGDNIQY